MFLNWIDDEDIENRKKRHLPYIKSICIDISGYPYPSNYGSSGGWNNKYINNWVRYQETTFNLRPNEFDYSINFNKVGKNELSQINANINSESYAAKAILIRPIDNNDKFGNGNIDFTFDVRIYGINYAYKDWYDDETQQYIELPEYRNIIIRNIKFLQGQPPSDPIIHDITIHDNNGYKISSYVKQILLGILPNDLNTGIVEYDISYSEYQTISAWNNSEQVYVNGVDVNTAVSKNINNKSQIISEQYVDIDNLLVKYLDNLRYGTRYNIQIRYKNDQTNTFSSYGDRHRYGSTDILLAEYLLNNNFYAYTKIPASLTKYGNENILKNASDFNDNMKFAAQNKVNLKIKGTIYNTYYYTVPVVDQVINIFEDSSFIFEITENNSSNISYNTNDLKIGKLMNNLGDVNVLEFIIKRIVSNDNSIDTTELINVSIKPGWQEVPNIEGSDIENNVTDYSAIDMYTDINKMGFRRLLKFKIGEELAKQAQINLPFEIEIRANIYGTETVNTHHVMIDRPLLEPELSGWDDNLILYDTSYVFCCGVKSVKHFILNHTNMTDLEIINVQTELNAVPDYNHLLEIRINNNKITNVHNISNIYDRKSNVNLSNFKIYNDTTERSGNKYNNIKYKFNQRFYNEEIDISYKLYTLKAYNGRVILKSTRPALHSDVNSFNEDPDRFIETPKTPVFYELSTSDNGTITSFTNVTILFEDSNLSQYNNHENQIKDTTLLYYDGDFQSPSSVDWVDMNNINGVNNNYPSNLSNISYSLVGNKLYDNTGYKWVVFKYDSNDYVGTNTTFINLNNLLIDRNFSSSKRANIINQLKINNNTTKNIIGLIGVKLSAPNEWYIGDLQHIININSTWYSKLVSNTLSLNDITNVAENYGAKVFDSNESSVKIAIDKTLFSNKSFYILLGVKNNFNFSQNE